MRRWTDEDRGGSTDRNGHTGHSMGQLDVKQEGTTKPTQACEEAAVSNQAFPILSIT